MEQKQPVNINLDSSVKPLYADEVSIACFIKQYKDEKGRITKEGNISLIFIDAMAQRAISRITLSKGTAKALVKILKENVVKLEEDINSKLELKSPVMMNQTNASETYIG